MNITERNGARYRLPSGLSDFQQEIYVHLIDWEWKHLTTEPGYYRGNPHGALLPESVQDQLLTIYTPVREDLRNHHQQFQFRTH